MKNILFVVTSVCKIDEIDRHTGFYLDELAIPLKKFIDKGWSVDIASIKGGEAPIEYHTLRPLSIRSLEQQWLLDSDEYFSKIRDTIKLSEVETQRYDAIFMPGGHGVMWDFKQCNLLGAIIANYFDDGKVVASICHGPASLLSAVSSKTNRPICHGKNVTCFTNEEEERSNMTKTVPFLVESELINQGGIFHKAKMRTPNCIADGNLITAQNPESSSLIADAVIDYLS